jgi:hypothetical protein
MEANQAAAWGAAEEWADRGIEALDRSEGSDSVSLRADLQIERFAALVGEGAPALASLRDCRQTFKKAGLERDWRAVTRVVDAERGRTMDAAILSEVLAMIEGCLASAEADGSSALLARKAALLHRISDPAARQECEDLSLEAMISAELPTADAEDRIHATAVFLLCNVFGRSPEERVRLGQGLLELLAEKADSNLLLVPSTTLVVDSLAGGDVAGADYAIGQISKQVALNAEHPTSWYPFHLNAMRCAMRGDAVGARRMLEAGLENTTAVTYLSAALCALVLQAHLCEIVGLPTAGGGPALPGLEFPEMPEGSTATTDLEVSEAAQAVQGAIRAPWSDQVVAIAAQLEGSRKVAELSAGGSVARVPVGAAPDFPRSRGMPSGSRRFASCRRVSTAFVMSAQPVNSSLFWNLSRIEWRLPVPRLSAPERSRAIWGSWRMFWVGEKRRWNSVLEPLQSTIPSAQIISRLGFGCMERRCASVSLRSMIFRRPGSGSPRHLG